MKAGMGNEGSSGLRRAAALCGAGLAAASATAVRAADLIGRPTAGGIGFQPGVTALRGQAAFFHDSILMPVLTLICILVLSLLIWVAVRFNAKANPTPARFTHHTTIEVLWTVAPVLILAFFAIFSFRLLYAYHNVPKPDLTVKVTGNQWYWNYEYPTAGGFAYDSNPLKEADAEAKGKGLYRLAVDHPMVVPVNKNVQVLTTGADVLHAFFVPAFGIQITSVPGRVNQTWFRATRIGSYYGDCNELCGVNHSFMPIEVDVVSQADYDRFVAAHGAKPASPGAVGPIAPPADVRPGSPKPDSGPPNGGAAPAVLTKVSTAR